MKKKLWDYTLWDVLTAWRNAYPGDYKKDAAKGDFYPPVLAWHSLGHAIAASLIAGVIALPAYAAIIVVLGISTAKEINDKGTLFKKCIDVLTWTIPAIIIGWSFS